MEEIESIKKQLAEQRMMLEEQQAMLRKIRRTMTVNSVFSFLRLLIIVVPIIIGIIYLPRLYNEARSSIGGLGIENSLPAGINIDEIRDLLGQ